MESIYKYLLGGVSAVVSLLAPISSLIVCAVIFISIDFVTGVMASHKRAKIEGVEWCFSSEKAWNTVLKLGFVMAGIVLAWLIDHYILSFMQLKLANLFTGFVCGVEFWSYLENASDISQHPIFRSLKTFMKNRLKGKLTNKNEAE